jgi:hypothetical protein
MCKCKHMLTLTQASPRRNRSARVDAHTCVNINTCIAKVEQTSTRGSLGGPRGTGAPGIVVDQEDDPARAQQPPGLADEVADGHRRALVHHKLDAHQVLRGARQACAARTIGRGQQQTSGHAWVTNRVSGTEMRVLLLAANRDPEMRILFTVTKQGPSFLFCMSNRTKCALLLSVVAHAVCCEALDAQHSTASQPSHATEKQRPSERLVVLSHCLSVCLPEEARCSLEGAAGCVCSQIDRQIQSRRPCSQELRVERGDPARVPRTERFCARK